MTETNTTTSTVEEQPMTQEPIPVETTDLELRIAAIDPIKLQSCLTKLSVLKAFNRFPNSPEYMCSIGDQDFTMNEIESLLEKMTPIPHSQAEA